MIAWTQRLQLLRQVLLGSHCIRDASSHGNLALKTLSFDDSAPTDFPASNKMSYPLGRPPYKYHSKVCRGCPYPRGRRGTISRPISPPSPSIPSPSEPEPGQNLPDTQTSCCETNAKAIRLAIQERAQNRQAIHDNKGNITGLQTQIDAMKERLQNVELSQDHSTSLQMQIDAMKKRIHNVESTMSAELGDMLQKFRTLKAESTNSMDSHAMNLKNHINETSSKHMALTARVNTLENGLASNPLRPDAPFSAVYEEILGMPADAQDYQTLSTYGITRDTSIHDAFGIIRSAIEQVMPRLSHFNVRSVTTETLNATDANMFTLTTGEASVTSTLNASAIQAETIVSAGDVRVNGKIHSEHAFIEKLDAQRIEVTGADGEDRIVMGALE